MEIKDSRIDGGRAFDWGRASSDYAKYRDIYPEEFYSKIVDLGLCINGQRVLDLGTGTGVLPRNMYRFGAKWTGTDISEEQIEQARILSQGTDIDFIACSAEDISFPDQSFDVVTACQCFWYFDHNRLVPKLWKMLKPEGNLLILYMAWLPFEDRIAGASEELVLKHNPGWNGCGETMHPIGIPDICGKYFTEVFHEEYKLPVHFTKKSWHGRMRACRGVGASLSPYELKNWDHEHMILLNKIAPAEFDILHYAALVQLKARPRTDLR